MQATQDEIDILYQIQQVDLNANKMNKEFEALPQRGVILSIREKKSAIEEKLAKVEALEKDARKRLTRIMDEDASLEKKEKGVQAAIEAAGNDFRNAETRTKELDGIFRRRNDIAESRKGVEEEIAKIRALEDQVNSALADLDKIEAEATESFKSEGSALMKAMADAKKAHDDLLSELSDEVAVFYEDVAKRFDTVSIGRLESNSCSVCRARIETGHLIDLKNQAPLAICPSCKRILIIQE